VQLPARNALALGQAARPGFMQLPSTPQRRAAPSTWAHPGLATYFYSVTSGTCATFKMVFWKDPQSAVGDHEHHPMLNEGSALAPGQLVSFTASFILKRNLCPYYLTSSSVAVNYIKAHFPKLRNFRIYFVACCYEESLLGIRAPACWGRRAGQTPAISVTPRRYRSCGTQTPLPTEVDPIPKHLPKEGAEPLPAAQGTGQPHCSPERRGGVPPAPPSYRPASTVDRHCPPPAN